jgi:hypothetical protein
MTSGQGRCSVTSISKRGLARITAQGGAIAFGALEAGLEVEYARDSIGFHWAGCEGRR